jgi:pimeloyl-ACP methyl ester carboxylesterase
MILNTNRSAGSPALRYLAANSSNPTLVLLHGVTRCAEDFQPLFEYLAPHWRLVAIDHRGHGQSERATSYQVTDYVADTSRFLREELAEPVVLYGHSLGAMLALAVAGELPEFVRGIILEDPPFHTMGQRIHGSAWQAQFRGMLDAATCGGTIEQLAAALADICLPLPQGVFKRLGDIREPAAIAWSAQCLALLDPAVLSVIVAGRWLDGYELESIAPRVRCPVSLLQADPSAGGALLDSDAEFLTKTLVNCSLETFAGCGHLLHWLQPQRVASITNRFRSA